MTSPHTPAQLEALRRLDACTLANAIESYHVRLRNEGFAAGETHCLFPKFHPMVGYAVTLKIRGASPPASGASTYLEHTDWWDYVLSVPAPRVVGVQDISSDRGRGALLGEVHVNILRALGCVGAVTNGSVRDVPAVEALGFHFFAASLTLSHSYVHIVETGGPVDIDGLTVRSGDLLHGDLHGVQTIPADLVPTLPETAAKIAARERALIAVARTPHITLEQLRAVVSGETSA